MLISISPFGRKYSFNKDTNDTGKIDSFVKDNKDKKVVVIQGLGFVGSAMLTAVASARKRDGLERYAVIGVDLASTNSYWKVAMVNEGRLPVRSSDRKLLSAFRSSFKAGNIMATADNYAYSKADIIIIDINLSVKKHSSGNLRMAKVNLADFTSAVKEIAVLMKPDCLIVVESTVPVGTCKKILLPLFSDELKNRGYKNTRVNLAHSYERVMPGKNYLKSITSYYRVFSGIDKKSKIKAREFLKTIVDTDKYPLTELHSVTASEMGKILENSFRAVNIAFIQEWTEFAGRAGVNLFEVIDAIRKRDTHRNIMLPGFGVGGFCLPKDPLLGDWSARNLFNSSKNLDFSINAVSVNDKMPIYSFGLLRKHLKRLSGSKILLMGVSYLKDVADTRYSPSGIFYKECRKNKVTVFLHDSIVNYWDELGLDINNSLPIRGVGKMDAIILALKHDEYLRMPVRGFKQMLKPGGLILDCSDVISEPKARALRKAGYKLCGVGKGHWNIEG